MQGLTHRGSSRVCFPRAVGVVLAALIVVAGCSDNRSPAPYLAVVTVDNPRSQVLAHIYATVVKATGIDTKVRLSSDPVSELDTGIASITPGFTGTMLHQFASQEQVSGDAETTYKAMIAALPAGVAAGDYGTAADKPAVAVSAGAVAGWPDATLANLVRHCDFLTRSGEVGNKAPPVRRIGGCETGQPREYRSTADLFEALRHGEVTTAWVTTGDVALPAAGITVLADGEHWLPANNVVPLYRRNELTEPQVLSLNKVAGELSTSDLAVMTRQVSEGTDPQQAVDAWLVDHQILVR